MALKEKFQISNQAMSMNRYGFFASSVLQNASRMSEESERSQESMGSSQFGTPRLTNKLTLSDQALIELIQKLKLRPDLKIEHLNLKNYHLSDKGLSILLSELSHLPHLKSVSFARGNVSNKIAKAISNKLEERTLEKSAKARYSFWQSAITSSTPRSQVYSFKEDERPSLGI